MKKRELSTIKLFFLFATLGAFPFLYPATQYHYQPMPVDYGRAFDVQILDKKAMLPIEAITSAAVMDDKNAPSKSLSPIDPVLGAEVKPDPIE